MSMEPVTIEGIIMRPPRIAPCERALISSKFAIVYTEAKDEALMKAICEEMQRRHINEAYLVNLDFVRDAIREKLERDGKNEQSTPH